MAAAHLSPQPTDCSLAFVETLTMADGRDSHSGSWSPSSVAVSVAFLQDGTIGNDGQFNNPPVSSLPTIGVSPAASTSDQHRPTRTRTGRSQSLPNLFADGHGGGGVWPSHWASLPPQQYVDYLHHPWTDDDLTNSWKLITKLKHSDRALKLGGKGERLEYLTWRIWIQRTRRLPKTHPYTIHWEKDSSHLYAPGPIFRAKSCFHLLPADLPTPSSPVPSSTLSTPPLSPSSYDHFKGCLKRHTLRDILLRPLQSSPSPHFVLSDPPAGAVARRRRTVEEHEELMRSALATASSDDSQQPNQQAHSDDSVANSNPSNDCRVLVCTATASHPALNLDAADAQVVRFNHVIEERVIAGPARTVVVASRKRRSRSLVMAVLDGNEAKAYRRVVDKWVGLDASKPSPSATSRGRPRARSDPPIPNALVSSRPTPARLRSRAIQDSAIAFSALVDDLLSSPENEDVISFVGTSPAQSPPSSRSSTPTLSPPSPSCRSHSYSLTPCENKAAAGQMQVPIRNDNEPNDDDFDDDTPTWERSTLARGRDHALPPFHVDESTLAMLALPYAVGAPPPSMTTARTLRVEHLCAVDLPTPPPSSPVATSAYKLDFADGRINPMALSNRSPSPTRLGSPPRRKPREPQVLAKVVARGTGWGIGHLDECELELHSHLDLEAAATEEGESAVTEEENEAASSQRESNVSLQEAVANVADAVGWLVGMVAGRAGLFST